MNNICVSGLINIETTLKVDGFPIPYESVRFPFWGVNSAVSGVGFNLAKVLTILGNRVDFVSMIGDDLAGEVIRLTLQRANILDKYVLSILKQTPQSIVMYDQAGKRQIHTDLKDIQERPFPPHLFQQAIENCSLALLSNINFNRPFLKPAKQAGKVIATDVHTIADLDDEYNADFMAAADILFMSHEKLPISPETWARRVQNRYGTSILVIGLGSEGALLAVKEDNFVERITAVKIRPIINTVGAGDALFSSFNHFYHKTNDPYQAIQKAILFASYKIGEKGSAAGFLTAAALDALITDAPPEQHRAAPQKQDANKQ